METKDKILVVTSWISLAVLGTSVYYNTTKNESSVPDHFLSDTMIPDPVTERAPKQKRIFTEKEEKCLARNIFYEAGVEDELGKLAIAQVTINRLGSGRWGKNICSVVHAKNQFSWTLDSKKLQAQPKGVLWEESVKAKDLFLSGVRVNSLKETMFYHTDYIKQPKWSKNMKQVKKIGRHIFYQG